MSKKYENEEHKLNDKWTLYYHDKHDSNWGVDSYMKIETFDTVEKFWKIYNSLPELADIMLFLMRNDIKPMWEDERNKHGGAYLYKIHNNKLSDIWTDVSCAVIGETLHTDFEMSKKITGISISPKFQTTTLRVWVADLNVEAKDFCSIGDGLEQYIFKKH